MNKKDIKLIIGLLIIAIAGVIVYQLIGSMHHGDIGVVEYRDEVILKFDIDVDQTYEFSGSYGVMHLEVKDSKFRVVDVECPNHNCEQMGWHDKDSLSPIVCMPNEVMIYTKSR